MEMIIKMLGVCLVVAGSGGCGWYLAYAARKRIDILQELLQALVVLYGDIEYAAGELSENIDRLARQTLFFSGFFSEVARRLDEREGQSLYRIWSEEAAVFSGRTRLNRDDLELLDEIGKNLGNLDRQTQLHMLHVMQGRLEGNIVRARDEYHSRAKLFRVVGITVGAFTAVLLI